MRLANIEFLRMLGGATFGPDANLILPSGRKLNGDEAQAFTAAFSEEPLEQKKNSNPLSSDNDNWTDDPQENHRRLVDRIKAAVSKLRRSQ